MGGRHFASSLTALRPTDTETGERNVHTGGRGLQGIHCPVVLWLIGLHTPAEGDLHLIDAALGRPDRTVLLGPLSSIHSTIVPGRASEQHERVTAEFIELLPPGDPAPCADLQAWLAWATSQLAALSSPYKVVLDLTALVPQNSDPSGVTTSDASSALTFIIDALGPLASCLIAVIHPDSVQDIGLGPLLPIASHLLVGDGLYPTRLFSGGLRGDEPTVRTGERTVSDLVSQITRLEDALALRTRQLAEVQNTLRMLESIVDSMGDGVFVVDEKGDMIFCNRSSQSILGYGLLAIPLDERVKIIGNYLPDKITPYPTQELPIARALRGESSDQTEIFIKNERRPEGVWISTTGRPLRDHGGRLRGGVVVFRDISKNKHEMQERLALEERIGRTQKLESLGVLAGGVAHDYNNLLMGVLGNVDLALMDPALPSAPRQRLHQIQKASQHLADLTGQLLAYAGAGTLSEGPVELSGLVKDMADLLRPAVTRRAVVRYSLAEEMPSITGDASQLRQVIMNLITNASDALEDQPGIIGIETGITDIPPGGLPDAYLSDPMQSGPHTYFEISDTGVGMSDVTLKRIFDPFFTTKFSGRGLGLAAVLGIVRRHHGTLVVKSNVGKGTTFRALFPIPNDTPAAVTAPANPQPALLPEKVAVALVADDEESVRTVVRDMLEGMGVEVVVAANGQEALKRFSEASKEIQLVLLDMTMPDMTGIEVLHTVVRSGARPKFIVSSGYHEAELPPSVMTSPDVAFLQKPFDSSVLKSAITKLFTD